MSIKTIISVPPIDFLSVGQPLSAWSISGNSQQNGTPTPTAPTYPEFVGEKTVNLFDGLLIGGHFTNTDFDIAGNISVYKSIKVFLSAGTYTFSWGKNVNVVRTIIDGTYAQDTYANVSSFTITNTTDSYVGISFRDATSSSTVWDNATPIMLNKGTTALPYEPYGYAIQTYTSTQNTVSGQTPLTITNSIGNNLISWDGEGATISSGTPAPTSPVTVSGWGDKTGNLFDEVYSNITTSVTRITLNVPNGNYTMSTPDFPVVSGASVFLMLSGESAVTQTNGVFGGHPVTQTVTDGKLLIGYRTNGDRNPADYHFMLNSGSTALPYEPYGYKLSLTSAGQNVPVYLGQTQTTRKVKKLVLTGAGDENWTSFPSSEKLFFLLSIPDGVSAYLAPLSNVYVGSNASAGSRPDYSIRQAGSSSSHTISILDSRFETVTAFKQWLATQYQNGTPVTVWYVLAEPTTGIVNEPLMKIGDYADSITATQAGVTIPTAKDNVILTTNNTVQPSIIHATYDKYISGGNVPVYFGQVQTTRWIKKLVLTGAEDWRISGTTFYLTSISPDYARVQATATYICTHFAAYQQTSSAGNVPDGMIALGYSSSNQRLYCAYTGADTVDGFKLWLADQYANGTPVTIWYVLAEPETGIVNEPLCKIGDYTDTVASTNTGAPSIPTSEGDNTLSIGTTLQPSEVSITYMAPNTIAENLQRLQIARTNIATAITTKGGTLVENAGFEDFPEAINNIPSESGGMPMAGITILLYDGSTFGDAGPTTIIEEGSI